MTDSNPSLMIAAIGLLGIVFGAVTSGLMKYAMERKNRLLQAYSQLIGKKSAITQAYANILSSTLDVYYNVGLKKDAEKMASIDKERKDNYLKQAEIIESDNEGNKKQYEERLVHLLTEIERFWKIIGTINGISSNKAEDKLIEDIRSRMSSLEKLQKDLINETKEGLPNCTVDGNNFLVSHWKENRQTKIDAAIKLLEIEIDLLINYIRDYENQTACGHPTLKDGVCFGPHALAPGSMDSRNHRVFVA